MYLIISKVVWVWQISLFLWEMNKQIHTWIGYVSELDSSLYFSLINVQQSFQVLIQSLMNQSQLMWKRNITSSWTSFIAALDSGCYQNSTKVLAQQIKLPNCNILFAFLSRENGSFLPLRFCGFPFIGPDVHSFIYLCRFAQPTLRARLKRLMHKADIILLSWSWHSSTEDR